MAENVISASIQILRFVATVQKELGHTSTADLLRDAADVIVGQASEIGRLRDELKRFALLRLDSDALPEDFGSMILHARAALSQGEPHASDPTANG